MKKIFVAAFAIFVLQLATFAKDDTCGANGSPHVKKHLEQIVRFVNKNDFEQLRVYVNQHWIRSDNEGRKNRTLVALSRFIDNSENLSLKRQCFEKSLSVRGFYSNEVTGAIDYVRVETKSNSKIESIQIASSVYATQKNRAQSESQKLKDLQSYLARLASKKLFSGVVLLAKNGQPLLLKSYGRTYSEFGDSLGLTDPFDPVEFRKKLVESRNHKREIRVSDKFNLASLNKIFTSVAMLQLVEKKRISLDDSVAKWLPDLVKQNEVKAVTIKHLLSHTSGIKWDLSGVNFKPGSKFSYSNAGYDYLGRIIEKVAGMSYNNYLRLNIFGPLEMANTDIFHIKRLTADLAIGNSYRYENGNPVSGPNPFLQKYPGSSVGGYYSTAKDLLKFAEGLRNGQLIRAKTLQLMISPKVELGAARYGYGVIRWEGKGIWGHGGDLPGADTDLEVYGNTGYVAIVLASRDDVNPPIQLKIRELFYPSSVKLFQ